jgi:hypothetical protein
MKRLTKIAVVCAMAMSCLALSGRSSYAMVGSEPINNNIPWTVGFPAFWGPVSLLTNYNWQNAGAVTFGHDAIDAVGDVDYLVMACYSPPGQIRNTIKELKITFTHASGDLDIDVFGMDGATIGGSHGVTDQEVVDTSALNRSVLVLKVYGYNNAQNSYFVYLTCQ